jgi:hypothetical protein
MKLKGLVEMFKGGPDGVVVESEAEAEERRRCAGRENGCRWLAFAIIAFWIGVAALIYSCNAHAGTQVYLEDERDLGNGYKLCIYSEGVTITRRDYQLCPISIEV